MDRIPLPENRMRTTAALLLVSPGAWAGVGQGDIEAGISISLNQTETDIEGSGTTDSDVGLIEVSGGYFFSDQLQFRLALSEVVSTDFTLPSSITL